MRYVRKTIYPALREDNPILLQIRWTKARSALDKETGNSSAEQMYLLHGGKKKKKRTKKGIRNKNAKNKEITMNSFFVIFFLIHTIFITVCKVF